MLDKYVIYYLRICGRVTGAMLFLTLQVGQSLERSIWTDNRVTGVDRGISTFVPLELFAKTLETGNILQQVTTNYLKWSYAGLMLETVNICITTMVAWWICDIGIFIGAFEPSSTRSQARDKMDIVIEEFSVWYRLVIFKQTCWELWSLLHMAHWHVYILFGRVIYTMTCQVTR